MRWPERAVTDPRGSAALDRLVHELLAVTPNDGTVLFSAESFSADARLVLWMQQAKPGTWEQRRAFLVSDVAAGLFPAGSRTTLWGSLEERRTYLAGLDGPYGHGFFPSPEVNGEVAQIDETDRGRLDAAWAQWLTTTATTAPTVPTVPTRPRRWWRRGQPRSGGTPALINGDGAHDGERLGLTTVQERWPGSG